MSEQILSQEEIDALLTAMDKGEVEIEEKTDKGESEVKAYDLTSQSIKLRDQYDALEEVYDKFNSSTTKSLSSMLQKEIMVGHISTKMIRFSDFVDGFSSPANLNIFTMEPLIGSALLVMEPELVFSLIDCMLGGTGKPIAEKREFTQIELRLIKKVVLDVLKNLESAWEVVCLLKMSLKSVETKPEFIHLAAPNDLMLSIVFSVTGDDFSGNIHICISYLMLEPIKENFSSKHLMEKNMVNTWRTQIQELLNDIHVNLACELGNTDSTVREILNIEAKDVLNLKTGPQDAVIIMVEGVPKYQGCPGIVKGNRAVEITSLIHKKRGQ